MSSVFVASDLEGTLTNGATWKGLSRYLKQNGSAAAYNRFIVRELPRILLARLRVIDLDQQKIRFMTQLTRLMRGMSLAEYQRFASWLVDSELWAQHRPPLIAELRDHLAAGRQVVLLSGTYQPVIERFATYIGEGIITRGTPLEVVDGHLTGEFAHPMGVGDQKIENLESLLNGAHLEAAYGDSMPDLDMLLMSNTPTAVTPEAPLRKIAQERGWRIWENT